LTHKTAWLNFYTALIGGFVALAVGTLTIINQQAKNPSIPISQSNNIATAETYYQRGQELAGKDDKGAIEAFTKAIELKPDDADAYFNRGNAKFKLGDKKGAIDDYNQVIKLKPDYASAYCNRGINKSDLGDKKRAIDDYNLAAKLFQQQGKNKYSQYVLEQVKKLNK
jgi:tetratricopeptide (TPR) repeat protein